MVIEQSRSIEYFQVQKNNLKEIHKVIVPGTQFFGKFTVEIHDVILWTARAPLGELIL